MTTYYMREDGTAANKGAASGPGSSQSACMNVSVHNGETFSAGDTIILADDGGNFTSRILCPSSGSSGNVITYQAETGDSPVVDGTGEGGAFAMDGDDYITVTGIEFVGGTNTIVANATGITLRNCTVRDAGENNVLATADSRTINDLLIELCTISSAVGSSGILVQKGGGSQPNGVTIQDNTVHDNGTDVVLDHNIYVKDCTNVVIQRNNTYNASASSIQLTDGASNVVVARNIARDSAIGIELSATIAAGSDIKVYYNLCYSNTELGIFNGQNVDGVEYYNNTCVNNSVAGFGMTSTGPISCIIKNNIFFNDYDITGDSAEPIRLAAEAEVNNNTFDYNAVDYIDDPVEPDKNYRVGGSKYTLGEWQALAASPGANDLNSNPLFLTDYTDFGLQSTSPCINAGADVSLTQDFDGAPVPQGQTVDIGAYEHWQEDAADITTYVQTVPQKRVIVSFGESQPKKRPYEPVYRYPK